MYIHKLHIICMYVCMYVCMYIYIYVYIYIYISIYLSLSLSVYIYIYIYIYYKLSSTPEASNLMQTAKGFAGELEKFSKDNAKKSEALKDLLGGTEVTITITIIIIIIIIIIKL